MAASPRDHGLDHQYHGAVERTEGALRSITNLLRQYRTEFKMEGAVAEPSCHPEPIIISAPAPGDATGRARPLGSANGHPQHLSDSNGDHWLAAPRMASRVNPDHGVDGPPATVFGTPQAKGALSLRGWEEGSAIVIESCTSDSLQESAVGVVPVPQALSESELPEEFLDTPGPRSPLRPPPRPMVQSDAEELRRITSGTTLHPRDDIALKQSEMEEQKWSVVASLIFTLAQRHRACPEDTETETFIRWLQRLRSANTIMLESERQLQMSEVGLLFERLHFLRKLQAIRQYCDAVQSSPEFEDPLLARIRTLLPVPDDGAVEAP